MGRIKGGFKHVNNPFGKDAVKHLEGSGNDCSPTLSNMHSDLRKLIKNIDEERKKAEINATNINKTCEKLQIDGKNASTYIKSRMKTLYSNTLQDAANEMNCILKALEKIEELRKKQQDGNRLSSLRRGVFLNQLHQNALTLPLWVGKLSEKPPPLCGAIGASEGFICGVGDKVAARVRSGDGEENWILAEVVAFNATTTKYDVDDIDAEVGKERHTLSKRRIVPLPVWRANPQLDPQALFTPNTLVLALYPQTTCFYRAIVHQLPKKHNDDYLVLFEDTTYPDGYSPPLNVAQRYVIACHHPPT